MAELSEQDINNIINKFITAARSDSGTDPTATTNQLLSDIKAQSMRTVRAIRQSTTKLMAASKGGTSTGGAVAVAKVKNKGKKNKAAEEKSEKAIATPLDTISKHLLDIKEFLRKTFTKKQTGPPSKLSQSTTDDPIKQLKDKKNKEKRMKDDKVVSDTQNALGWLGALFTIGALPVIAKTLGIGAAGGVGGGLLAKILPKIFPVAKGVLRRIPIIGSLFSFYEAYKKFKEGGIDNILFGIMDLAAGIAYAVPGVGTAIGLGLDVLQYFLKNKADEWKKETGETSFFGNMWDTMMGYLKETPIFKWMIDTGKAAKEFWNNPTWETFKAMGIQFGSILQPLLDTFSMFNKDAGAALGLKDKEGKAQGLFSWIGDKVDEWIITPVMGFLEGIFVSIGEGMISMANGIDKFIKRVVDNNIGDGIIKDGVYIAMGWNSGPEPDGGHGEVEGLTDAGEHKDARKAGLSKLRKSDQEKIKRYGKLVGGSFAKQEYFDSLDSMTDEQIATQLQILKQRASKRGQELKKIPDPAPIPGPHEADPWKGIEAPGMSNVQNNVSSQSVTNYITDPSPSTKFLVGELNAI